MHKPKLGRRQASKKKFIYIYIFLSFSFSKKKKQKKKSENKTYKINAMHMQTEIK
jgi:hypothetical protein